MTKFVKLTAAASLMTVLFLASCSNKDANQATPTVTDAREKFHGIWAVTEISKDYGSSTYNCTIADSTAANYIQLAYLYGFSKKIYSTVSESNLTIPVQTIQGSNVSGNGSLVNANRINLTYYVQTSSTHYDTVTAVLTK